ncbi:MAG: IclR family transcriptional regulator [Rhodobacter sp.]|nr:IclR family transcriptional regulator [Rhodobacter sp.]
MPQAERIPTNLRTLMIVEVLGRSDGAMTATEINSALGLPKQTVHRLCTTLEAAGFLMRQGSNSKRYLPARRLRDLGAGLLFSSHSHIARHQVLLDVARQVRETVNFVVPEETGMSYLDRVETDWPFRIQLPVGTNVPFHCTASGKAYMASLPPATRRGFVAGLDLERLTARTHTSAEPLLDDLALTARRGYALDDEEFMDGMVAIAVPVVDAKGRYVASLAFHGPVQRISIEHAIARKEVLLDGARRLRDALLGT